MIPYIHVPDLKVGPLTLHPFGLLVATGVIVGTWLVTRRARSRGVDVDKLNSFISWVLVAGFLGGHMLDQIFYHWADFVKRPWSLFLLYEGLSSFGGFTGAVIGGTLWKYFEARPWFHIPIVGITIPKFRRRPATLPLLAFSDLMLSVFPVAWVFGRSGCSVVHDHPGMFAPPETLLAVAYGPVSHVHKILSFGDGNLELRWGTKPQFDLGLLEMMFTLILASMIALTWRRKLTTGTYSAVTALAYAPVRFAMDYLRVRDVDQADPRYGGLTPAQWLCVVLFVFGLVMVVKVRNIAKSGVDPLDAFLASPPNDVPDVPVEPEHQSAT
jgi:phosphatidylglycerol:prolipoprotein diacylglycerol transferase